MTLKPRSTHLTGCLALAVTGLSSDPAAAQQTAGFALNRFDPSEPGSDWFVAESLDFRGNQRLGLRLVLDYANKPLVIYSADGEDEQAAVVEHQLFGHIGAALILVDRVRFGLSVPIALYQAGESGTALGTTFSSDNDTTVGDLRVGADVRLFGEYGQPATMAAGVQLHAPTGSRSSFTGDESVRIVPRLALAGQLGSFAYAGRLGVNLRTQQDDFADANLGSELVFAAAAGLRALDGKLTLGPELFGSTVFSNSDAFFARATTPVEVVFGGHFVAGESWRIGAGVGPGLTRGLGTPAFRVLASLEFMAPYEEKVEPPPPPPAPPSDRDLDGISDLIDACPDEPGIKTDDPKTNGCPEPKDSDADGISDAEDACPNEPGPQTDDPKTNGCPPLDLDKDGIPDKDDACPDEAGVKTDDPKTHGCPPPKDSDGDGILDPEDACPKAAGPRNEDPKKNGCPLARVEEQQIKITEQVQFAYNSAQILKASDALLNAVKKILVDFPQITKVSIEGHTDSKGGDAFNKGLSDRRAKAVMQWLIKNGIDKSRLEAKGSGEEKPLDSNDTEEGRANNRRVEFHILEQGDPGGTPLVPTPP
jgi:outer membrane protein OmpA-like peptidoglycan-associated protein